MKMLPRISESCPIIYEFVPNTSLIFRHTKFLLILINHMKILPIISESCPIKSECVHNVIF